MGRPMLLLDSMEYLWADQCCYLIVWDVSGQTNVITWHYRMLVGRPMLLLDYMEYLWADQCCYLTVWDVGGQTYLVT